MPERLFTASSMLSLLIATHLKVASSWLITLECPMTMFFFFVFGPNFRNLGVFFFRILKKKRKFCDIWGIFLPFNKIKIIKLVTSGPRHFLGHYL